jgi:hypothetical protein
METPAREATSRIVTLMNRLKEEKPKNSHYNVNVYIVEEKKECRACKRLHFKYREMAAICQGECLGFCE